LSKDSPHFTASSGVTLLKKQKEVFKKCACCVFMKLLYVCYLLPSVLWAVSQSFARDHITKGAHSLKDLMKHLF